MSDPPSPGPADSGKSRRNRGAEFDAFYAGGVPPWDIGRPQAAFLHLAETGALRPPVLDIGCGTGEHALMAAGMGPPATGIDMSPTAIEIARRKAKDRGLDVRFVVWDALDLPAFGERFNTVLDCGVFHVFDDDDRSQFVASLRSSVVPGGHYHMLCFSDKMPGVLGPRRVSQDEIRTSFADGWRVESIEPAHLEIVGSPEGALAWFSVIARV